MAGIIFILDIDGALDIGYLGRCILAELIVVISISCSRFAARAREMIKHQSLLLCPEARSEEGSGFTEDFPRDQLRRTIPSVTDGPILAFLGIITLYRHP